MTLRVLIVLCVAGWIAALLSRLRIAAITARLRRLSSGHSPRMAIWWATGLLGLIFLAATVGSVSPGASWNGSYEWRQGAITFLACLALFAAAAASFRTTAGIARLVGLVELTSVPVAAYGILQYFGLSLFPWSRTVEGRAFSSLGHPNFLAAYLVLVIPVAAARLAASSAWRDRGLHLAVIAVDGVCLLLTFSRSGWLGLLVAAACFGGLRARWRSTGGPTRHRWRAAGLVVAGLALFAVVAYLDPHGWFSYSALEPIHSFLRGKSATAQVRALVWGGTLQAIRSRPWLGYGPETFRLSFPQAYPPALSIYGGVVAAGDHAHNEWLDWTLNAGVLGLAAYVWWLVAVFRHALRGLPHLSAASARWLQIGLVSAAAGYLAQNQLSFGTIAPLAHFWLFLGLTFALARGAGCSPPDSPAITDFGSLRDFRNLRALLAAAAFVALTSYFVLWPDVKSLAADVPAAEARQASEVGDCSTAVARYGQALRLAPDQDRYLAWQAAAYSALGVERGTSAAFTLGDAQIRTRDRAVAARRSLLDCPGPAGLPVGRRSKGYRPARGCRRGVPACGPTESHGPGRRRPLGARLPRAGAVRRGPGQIPGGAGARSSGRAGLHLHGRDIPGRGTARRCAPDVRRGRRRYGDDRSAGGETMRILFAGAYVPYPLTSGGRIRSYHLLRELAGRHEVHLVALRHEKEIDVGPLRDLCATIQTVPAPARPAGWLSRVWRLCSNPDDVVVSRSSARLGTLLHSRLSAQHFDLLFLDDLGAERYLRLPDHPPTVLSKHNSEGRLLDQLAALKRGRRTTHVLARWEAHVTRRREVSAIVLADQVIVPSDADRRDLLANAPGARVFVAPNGVDTRVFPPSTAARGHPPDAAVLRSPVLVPQRGRGQLVLHWGPAPGPAPVSRLSRADRGEWATCRSPLLGRGSWRGCGGFRRGRAAPPRRGDRMRRSIAGRFRLAVEDPRGARGRPRGRHHPGRRRGAGTHTGA